MKFILYNMGYFFKETKKVIGLNLLSNIFSFVGTILILFILALIIAGWNVSNRIVQMLKNEAEISAYFQEHINDKEKEQLINTTGEIDGVLEVRLVSNTEAYSRMENVLGNEAEILGLFETNPFEEYIEIRIHLDETETIIEKVKKIKGIEFVRDNRDVLVQIEGIVKGLNTLGILIIAAVGITTIVIISHMIRQGIYDNKEQINTLQLLGASNSFIGLPFFFVGLIMTIGGGIFSSIMIMLSLNISFKLLGGSIPFIPLPPLNELTVSVMTIIMSVSLVLGIVGSIFGLSSIKEDAKS